MSNEIGFVILRHVMSKETNMYWQECYDWVRKFYDWPILIVDDNSNEEFVDCQLPLSNVTIVKSKFKSRGEILALYYFAKLKPFDKAIIIHDSMFIKAKFQFENFEPNRPLLTFAEHEFDDDQLCESLIKLLDNHEELIKIYRQKHIWKGCFGVMMVVKLDFIDFLNKRYDLFDTLLANIDTRKKREQVERIFGCFFEMHGSGWPAIFGDIDFSTKPTYRQYKEGVHRERLFTKVFTGR